MWKQQRRFALSTLRYFGFGKKSLEPIILNEFTHCAKDISSFNGKYTFALIKNSTEITNIQFTTSFMLKCVGRPFTPHLIINNAVSNIICTLVFGHRFKYTDEKFGTLITNFEKAFQMQTSVWGQVHYFKSAGFFHLSVVIP